jgi:peptide-methionine (S)-S-oxide reductase
MNNFNSKSNIDVAIFGGGCFWCLEEVYLHVKGVIEVFSGYAGGQASNPSYGQVSTGKTGHAEVVKVLFDPSVISYDDILHIFFSVHDPTTLNRQGNDIGTQYRSLILFSSEKQHKTAQEIIRQLEAEKLFEEKIVTELLPLETFYLAEQYHQKYFEKNPTEAYCQIVIAPKMAKFRQKFSNLYM